MQIVVSPEARLHLEFWRKNGNKNILKKIRLLIDAIVLNPFEGIGKPEPL